MKLLVEYADGITDLIELEGTKEQVSHHYAQLEYDFDVVSLFEVEDFNRGA